MTTIQYGDHGLAAFEQSGVFKQVELFAGPTPMPITDSYPVGESTVLAANTPVKLDANGNIVKATKGTPAIGVTVTAVETGAGQTGSAALYVAGCFNPEALAFDASYVTLADKVAAFRGASAPTQIIIRPTAV